MSRYEIAVRTPAAAAASAYCDIRTTATKPVSVLELGVFTSAANSLTIGVGRPATVGTASTSTTFLAEKSGDATGVTVMGTAWSAAPTVPANFLRRITTPANTGAGFIWQWPPGSLTIPISGSIVVWSITAGVATALDVYAVIDE